VTGVATAILKGRPVAVTTSEDGTGRVWDLATGRATATLTGHTGWVTGVATAILKGRPVAVTMLAGRVRPDPAVGVLPAPRTRRSGPRGPGHTRLLAGRMAGGRTADWQ